MCAKYGLFIGSAFLLFPLQAHAAGKLPIAEGVWVDEAGNCATSFGVTIYDGNNFGGIYYYGEGHSLGPSTGINPIVRTATGKNGYTNAWYDNNSNIEGDLSIKPVGTSGYITRWVNYGNGRMGGLPEVSLERSKKCGFAQLSPKMQAAVRKFAPKLAPTGLSPVTTRVATQAALPAPVAPLNIRPGHYLPQGTACSDGGGMIFYYDGKRSGWIDTMPFNASGMDLVSSLKKKGKVWDTGYFSTIRVDGVDHFFYADPNTGDENMRWCPASQVRASARPR